MNARTSVAYVMVAGFCLILTNVGLIVGDRLGMPLWLTVLLSFAVVATAGYVLHAIFTFRQPLSVRRLLRYEAAMSANIPLTFVTSWIWNVAIGLPMTLAAPAATACLLALNFVLGRWAIAAPSSQVAGTSR